MKPGDAVQVSAFGPRMLERVVCQVIDSTVIVCTMEEWESATEEMREPDGVGFPRGDVREMS